MGENLTLRPKFVFIVDDDRDILECLQTVLEDEGYRVETAENGEVALRKLAGFTELPDLILLDLMMRVMDGRAFLEEVARRSPNVWARIPIILSTAATQETLRGIPDHAIKVQKPFELDYIFRLIHELTAPSTPAVQPVLAALAPNREVPTRT